jgi:hypothetical protein
MGSKRKLLFGKDDGRRGRKEGGGAAAVSSEIKWA